MTNRSRSRLRRAARRFVRRAHYHLPFVMYTVATLSYAGWVTWELTNLH